MTASSEEYEPGYDPAVACWETAHWLSDDGMTLTIERRTRRGTRTTTVHRDPADGPFTPADVDSALTGTPAGAARLPGQRNTTRRRVTRYGTLYSHVMHGPPTWWRPRMRREDDGTVMAGWLRLAVAVWFDRAARRT